MEIIHASEAFHEPLRRPTELFTGSVSQRAIMEFGAPVEAEMLFVRFEEGARTHWHSHSAGQFIHVLSGETAVQVEGEPVVLAGVGDIIIAAPNERHWHGATAGATTAHAVHSLGTEEWDGPAPAYP